MKIYHNPRCRKSREALAILEEKMQKPEIFLYLEEKITQKSLKELLQKLNMKPSELVRKTEQLYKDEFKNKVTSEKEWIKILIEHPKLIERPIVISGDRAVVARPPERLLELL